MIAPAILDGEGFKVRIEHHYGYLRAYVHDGRDSLQVSIAMWKLLSEQCAKHGVKRLLVVEDLASTVDVDDIAKVVDAMADFGFAKIRTAFVELQSDIQGSELGEILASERGVTVHVSGDEVAARHWLMYGE
ncbi:hypothetical protein LYSHEL_24560 [Lysobacter helvus]|uniref:Uncharacterized protein n=2 Tax=Lysobacteraceae TaxID=32033 RepID=A0ABN6FUQ3_9GAMM|nr:MULTISPECIES: hypothetical protein [Lysobacter]BCT93432.1 hypothetical protein LYSCAS_24560 [Lysobacter caseinilyticus]BCT96585.1 hypothetical protein LYSHEL_24560 [Lysobacter helvus]